MVKATINCYSYTDDFKTKLRTCSKNAKLPSVCDHRVLCWLHIPGIGLHLNKYVRSVVPAPPPSIFLTIVYPSVYGTAVVDELEQRDNKSFQFIRPSSPFLRITDAPADNIHEMQAAIGKIWCNAHSASKCTSISQIYTVTPNTWTLPTNIHLWRVSNVDLSL